MIVVAVLISILIRGAVLGLPEYGYDVGFHRGWGRAAVDRGVAGSYSIDQDGVISPNYPPLNIYIFYSIQRFLDTLNITNIDVVNIIYKLPPTIADYYLALLIYRVVDKTRGKRYAGLASCLFLLSFPTWYDSSAWGQTDVLLSLFCLGATFALARERFFLGGVLAGLALMTKVQSIIFLPVIAILVIRVPQKMWRFFVGIEGTVGVLLLPFILSGNLTKIVYVFQSSVGFYHRLSFNAYNFWWLLYGDASGGNDSRALLGPLSAMTIGVVLFSTVTLVFFVRYARWMWSKNEKLRIYGAFIWCGVISLSFFLFNTQMHERYLYPWTVFALPVIFLSRKLFHIYLAMSVLFFLNLIGVMHIFSWEKTIWVEVPNLDVIVAFLIVTLSLIYLKLLFFEERLLKSLAKL